MANSFDSNITAKLARTFLPAFESARVLSKRVNTQLFDGARGFDPSTGDTISVKRPTDYKSVRTAAGDLTAATASDIITGKASATVQNYITVFCSFTEADQAIKMDQLDQLLAPMATRMVTDLELDFANFMLKGAGLYAGTIGNAATTWDEIAEFGAVMQAAGVPMDERWTTVINPFTQRSLASNQRSLGGGAAGKAALTAHERAIITSDFAGMDVVTGTTLKTYTTGAGSDRAGAINGSPTVTYSAAKDTMTQSIPVDGFDAALPVKAGDRVQVAGTYQMNMSTREPMIDETGAKVLWTGTVTADVTMSTGAGTLVVTGPAIYEATGAYNTVDRALADNDVITILGAASTTYQPNLFFHPRGATIASVPMQKLYSTDTLMQTKDGLQMRCSKFSNGTTNTQTVRFDLRPAYGIMNPFFIGAGYGVA